MKENTPFAVRLRKMYPSTRAIFYVTIFMWQILFARVDEQN